MNFNKFKKRQKSNLWKDKVNEIIDQKFTFSKFNNNNNTSETIIEENCSPEKFDRLSILFESDKNNNIKNIINNNNNYNNYNNNYNNNSDNFNLTKFWLLKDNLTIYEWKNFNYVNIQNQIIENLENQFEKSLLHNDDFQITKTIKFNQIRCEPTIGYRPNNRIINNNNNNNNSNNEENYHPSIVFDVGFYQTLNDLLFKSKIYFTFNNIKIVILLKFWFNEIDNSYKILLIQILKDGNNFSNNNNNNFSNNNKPLKLKIERILILGNNNDITDDKSILSIINNWFCEMCDYKRNKSLNNDCGGSNLIELPLSHLYYNVPDGEISKNQKNIKIDINQIIQIIDNFKLENS
ncbi:hypothetical protein ACTFIW_006559 [Dictyostelium discoideum]